MEAHTRRAILPWELASLLLVIALVRPLNYLYDRFPSLITALLAPVNESIWEHLKLCFVPVLLVALLEYPLLRGAAHNFLVAKAAALLTMVGLIVVVTPVTTALLPAESAAVHIATYVAFVVAGQLLSYRLLRAPELPRAWPYLAAAAVIVLGVMLGLFTYWPPHGEIFRDSILDSYGIPR